MSGGSETTTTESTQKRDPWGPAASPIQNQVIPLVSQWGQGQQQFTGPTYIDPTQQWQQGFGGLGSYMGGAGAGIVDPTLDAWRGSLDPMNRLNAPGAMNPLNLYASEVGRNLNENIRPGYAMGAINAGQHGGYSSERAQNERIAERDASEAISKYGAGLFSDLYSQGLQMQQNAMGMAPGMFQLGQSPYRGMMALGDLERGEQYTQQGMDRARQQFEQDEELNRASRMFNVLGPAAQLGGTSIGSQTQTREQEMGLGQFLGPMMSLGLGAATGGAGFGLGGLGGFGSFSSWNPGIGYYNAPNLMSGPFPGSYGR